MTSAVLVTTGCAVAATLGAYRIALTARSRWNVPLANPVLIATTLVVAYLELAHLSYADYTPAMHLMTVLLGPATVALALPLYRNRALLVANLVPASVALALGSASAMIACGSIARAFALGPTLVASLSIKSTTAPIAVQIAKIVRGDPAITAVFVVMTGILGAIVGPWLMDRAHVRTPLARGLALALGTISHGIGTAQAATESEFTGAIAGVAMGVGAIFMATVAPVVVPLLAR